MKKEYIESFMDMACRFGLTSKAQRLKVGCLIYKNDAIISCGVNGQPPKWPTEECEDENFKTLDTVRHAEVAALEKLWNSSETTIGSYMFVSHLPCIPCATKIVTAKIDKVFWRYQHRCDASIQYLTDRGIEVIHVPETEFYKNMEDMHRHSDLNKLYK